MEASKHAVANHQEEQSSLLSSHIVESFPVQLKHASRSFATIEISDTESDRSDKSVGKLATANICSGLQKLRIAPASFENCEFNVESVKFIEEKTERSEVHRKNIDCCREEDDSMTSANFELFPEAYPAVPRFPEGGAKNPQVAQEKMAHLNAFEVLMSGTSGKGKARKTIKAKQNKIESKPDYESMDVKSLEFVRLAVDRNIRSSQENMGFGSCPNKFL
ncbi:hypothetical protein HDU83_002258 [Entophlyctis luteolus]|nr:hypothetical protein HDU83_002258 [Entophlyctis luteolus]